MRSLETILAHLTGSPHLDVRLTDTPWRPDDLVVEPHFGQIVWTPPPSYRAALAAGLVGAWRDLDPDDDEDDEQQGFRLYAPDEIGQINSDLVHMPEGVSRDEGIYLSTNHLVGFAEASGEAVWCFDVTTPDADGEYPVYYHHQDEPRARILATGAWEEPTVPDFVSFSQWLETMTAALLAPEPPSWFEDLGLPGMTFEKKRLTLPK